MSNIFIALKKDLFGCFRIEEIRDKDNETGLKDGGVIEIKTTSIYTMHAPFTFVLYLPNFFETLPPQMYGDATDLTIIPSWHCSMTSFIQRFKMALRCAAGPSTNVA